jgi:hypothetical protein
MHIYLIQSDSKLLSGFPGPVIIKQEAKIKLLMQYENVAQKVLLPLDSLLQNAKQLQHARLSWHITFENYCLLETPTII